MNRDIFIGIVMGLLGGFIIGYFTGTSGSANQGQPVIAAAVQMPSPGAAPAGLPPNSGAMPNSVEAQARMFSNEQIVAREPKNMDAWKLLGNDYFDAHQPQKAVDAYAKVLELEPKNADVLTDQGIMYRQLMAYDKAIANFEKASKADPKHVQCLFNMGIVYSQDLKQNEKAIKAWNRVIEIAPTSQQAAQARAGIAELNSHLKIK